MGGTRDGGSRLGSDRFEYAVVGYSGAVSPAGVAKGGDATVRSIGVLSGAMAVPRV